MKNGDRIVQGIASLVLLAFVLALFSLGFKYIECKIALKKLQFFPQSDYAHFILYGSSEREHTVSGTLMLYDTDGTEVSRIERSWNDSRLGIEYVVVTMGNKSAAFPYRIFGGSSVPLSSGKSHGHNLSHYVMNEKECTLIGKSMGEEARKNWGKVARFAYSPASRIFSSSIDFTTVNLAGCQPGKEYLLKTDQFGNITLGYWQD